jgi:FkbM family methyltransferase
MKNLLRPYIEWIFRRLPVSRVAFAERDALAAQLRALATAMPTGSEAAESLRVISQIEAFDPQHLEVSVPVMRSPEERTRIATLCRDADVLPRVPNAGAVVQQEDGTLVQIMHNGIKVLAGGYYGDWMQDLIARCHGVHEPQEDVAFAEIMKHLSDHATMIELGGFWSYYSIWFLSEGAGRRAIVEPDPAHIEVGRTNARLSACKPEFVQAFAGRHSAPPSLLATEVSGEVVLPCVSMPDLMASRTIDSLDVLHCDAQGAELDILEGCQDLVAAGRLGWVVVSTHSHYISGDPLTHQRCLAWLARAGATILAEHDVHESFSGDGLIVAKFGTVPERWQRPRLSFNRYSESLFRNPLYDLAGAPRDAQSWPAFRKTKSTTLAPSDMSCATWAPTSA